jgi:hypothetical protein
MANKIGPMIEPCITSQEISSRIEVFPSLMTKNDLPDSHSSISLTTLVCKPTVCVFDRCYDFGQEDIRHGDVCHGDIRHGRHSSRGDICQV